MKKYFELYIHKVYIYLKRLNNIVYISAPNQWGYVFTPVRWLVQKLQSGFPRNFVEGWDMGQEKSHKMLVCECRNIFTTFFNIAGEWFFFFYIYME